ncbi:MULTISPECIES: non-heme iron oxygenase ferredoxin subunit [unclassified Beijerinckia]|uniref:non-heme iron oxygenase ferredoxin subunit n=1 Tax=unclassified Beijerinckia TaxID=2638183 RepID=UPI00089A0AED|nr:MULTISPECIES: non-heme iron oxygenase ferredoxin subunit [unclassified Beijerinckia]MDH7798263.1 nitrite reductase/ring-hydroxylating ferredoxin subunit [Beijerinckia sp. GAS462]SED14891.1 3-phenylpropionate/trans-cinnamate dioxygenase ferredoxin subunit/carbazole 1,9a-dioxygenase, ferredoxin component [Beijerinckia sp. 28-YEA-48]
MSELTYHRVASTADLDDGDMREAQVGATLLAIYRLGEDFYATAGICTHAYARMAEGYVEGEIIECPYHGGAFEIRTGKAVAAPCTHDLKTFPVRVDGEDVLVGLPVGLPA